MKESGMEKLIELLNEYDNGNWEVTDYGALFNRMNEGISETEDLQVISKKFGFIKWLVDNDKIDFDKTGYKKADFQEVWNGDWRTVRGYEMLLMLLAISNTPIEDLISYLK